MLILLPPSEGKSAPLNPTPFDLASLIYAEELTPLRTAALSAAGVDLHGAMADSASAIYNGVLYKALDWTSLSALAKRRGKSSIRIISALFGVVSPNDKILKYKSKITNSHWRPEVGDLLSTRNDSLIIDCRSSTYHGVWTPPHEKTVEVRVFQVKDGERSIITHMSKKYRGELVRSVLLLKSEPRNIQELLTGIQPHFTFDFTPFTSSRPNYLDLLIEI